MSTSLDFESYIKEIDLSELLNRLGTRNVELILEGVKHFTEKEAERRDKILMDYFGEEGIERITKTITDCLLSPPKLKSDAKILDVGAGSGLFTVRVFERVRNSLPDAFFYAMDVTPAMLMILRRKTGEVTPFLGIAENITGSAQYASKYMEVPDRFDAIFSTLTLHHCPDITEVFKSIKEALESHGKAVLIDLCKHPFKKFREEMGDLHLGFNPSIIKEEAEKFFTKVNVKEIPGLSCECSNRAAHLFVAYLIP